MTNPFKKYILFLFLVFSLNSYLTAQEAVVSDFLNVYSFTCDKIAQLAGAIPEDKYDWRPAEGVRSVKESVLHAAGAGYFFASFLGAKAPDGVNTRDLEKQDMSKEEVIATYKKSIEIIQMALKNVTAAQLEEEIDLFGNKMTKRQVMILLGDHTAEHLGQLIAYARSNGVAPPWSKKN